MLSATMSHSPDIAHAHRGWKYVTGRQNREQELIIRTRTAFFGVDRALALTFSQLSSQDDTGAGQSWSPLELAIDDASHNTLAVVVGEILEEGDVPHHKRNTRSNEVVPTKSTAKIVVRPLFKAFTELYVLRDKQHGLCTAERLPYGNSVKHRIAYYSEWTISRRGSTGNWHRPRQLFHHQLNGFCREVVKNWAKPTGTTSRISN